MVMEIIISVILLLVGIAVLIMIHVCIVGRAFRRGFGDIDGVPQRGTVLNIRARGMNPNDLNKLPCFEYKEEEEEKKGISFITCAPIVDCAICLDNFNVGDKCRVLPNCHHFFHVSCIDLWLVKSPFCPICRASSRLPSKVCSDMGEGSNV